MRKLRFGSGIGGALVAVALAGTASGGAQAKPGSKPPLACANQAYVTNSYANTVTVIDTRTDSVVSTIPVGKGPVNPTFTPDGTHVYLSNTGDRTLSVIDTRTRSLVRTLDVGPNKPNGLAFTPDGRHLLISYFQTLEVAAPPASGSAPPRPASGGPRSTPVAGEGRVLTLWNAETKEMHGFIRIMTVATGALSAPISVGMGAERVAITPDGRRAYVANLGSGTVTAIDLVRRRVIATIPTGQAGPFNVSITRDGKRVFVGNSLGTEISVIDPATNRIAARLATTGGPNGMGFTPDYRRLYVTTFSGKALQVIDTQTLAVSAPVALKEPPGFLRFTPDGRKAYFVSPFGSSVSVLDPVAMILTGSIPTGRGPSVVTICGAP